MITTRAPDGANKTGRRGCHWQGCWYSSRGTWPRVICKNGESDWVDNDMGIVGQSSMLSALSGCYTLCHDGSPANQPLWILLLPPVGQLGKKIPVWWNTQLEIYQGQTGKSAQHLFTSFVCCSLFRQYLLWIEAIGGWKIGLEFNLLFKKGPRTRAGSEEALQDWIVSANLTVNGHTLKGKEFNTLHSIFMTNQIK